MPNKTKTTGNGATMPEIVELYEGQGTTMGPILEFAKTMGKAQLFIQQSNIDFSDTLWLRSIGIWDEVTFECYMELNRMTLMEIVVHALSVYKGILQSYEGLMLMGIEPLMLRIMRGHWRMLIVTMLYSPWLKHMAKKPFADSYVRSIILGILS
jgi:hypothetical protein